jgi:small subunit ribosomal protein S9
MEVINALGRRKTAVARVFVKEGSGIITINGREFTNYFPTPILRFIVEQPLEITNNAGKYDITVNLDGGGFNGQAEALSLGIARALCKIDAENRPPLKAKLLLRRDPRMVERKKPGQKKARKKFQFSKR